MKTKTLFLILMLCFTFSVSSFAASAKAIIEGTSENSELVGIVRFQDTEEGLRVEVSIFGATPGLHGMHLHEHASCGDTGKAAGDHFNPEHAKHGFLPTEGFTGAHAGDFGNIEINSNGEGTLFLIIPGLTVAGGKYNIEGRSVVFHEKQDDFGQPAGNAGARVGCGIVTIDQNPDEKTPAV